LDGYRDNLTARFTIQDDQSNETYLQLLVPGMEGRSYFRAKSPKTKTSGKYYAGKTLPVFTIHTASEAKTQPFIAIFEPFKGKGGFSVDRILLEKTTNPGSFTAFTVYNKNNTTQEIYQSTDPDNVYSSKSGTLHGAFGVATVQATQTAENGQLLSLYLGSGTEISSHGYRLRSTIPNGSANLTVEASGYRITCNQPTEIGLPGKDVKKAWLKMESGNEELKITKSLDGLRIHVQAIKDGWLVLE
jgi:hypothetical protein